MLHDLKVSLNLSDIEYLDKNISKKSRKKYFGEKYNEYRVCNILHHFTVNLTRLAVTDMEWIPVPESLSLLTWGCHSQFPKVLLAFNFLCLETTLTSEKSSRNWEGSQGKDSPGPAESWAVKLSAITLYSHRGSGPQYKAVSRAVFTRGPLKKVSG